MQFYFWIQVLHSYQTRTVYVTAWGMFNFWDQYWYIVQYNFILDLSSISCPRLPSWQSEPYVKLPVIHVPGCNQ